MKTIEVSQNIIEVAEKLIAAANISRTYKLNETISRYYEIRVSGKQQNYFTLWSVTLGGSPYVKPDEYHKNLSTDLIEAVKEAIAFQSHFAVELIDDQNNENIVRFKDNSLRFGKYRGHDVESVDDKYLEWLLGGARVKSVDGDFNLIPSDSVLFTHVQAEALKRNLAVLHEGKVIAVSMYNWIQKMKAGQGYHLEAGKRIELELTVVHVKFFDGQFGRTYIITLENAEGLKFIYKGGAECFRVTDGGITSLKGQTLSLIAKIEHKEWNSNKQTYISRPTKVKLLTEAI